MGELLRRHLARTARPAGAVPPRRRRPGPGATRWSPTSRPAPAPPLLLVSLKAGGTGLNLTAASQVIHYDRWWNPAVEDQATDRAWRIGQGRTVHRPQARLRGHGRGAHRRADRRQAGARRRRRRQRRGVAVGAVDGRAARARAAGSGRGAVDDGAAAAVGPQPAGADRRQRCCECSPPSCPTRRASVGPRPTPATARWSTSRSSRATVTGRGRRARATSRTPPSCTCARMSSRAAGGGAGERRRSELLVPDGGSWRRCAPARTTLARRLQARHRRPARARRRGDDRTGAARVALGAGSADLPVARPLPRRPRRAVPTSSRPPCDSGADAASTRPAARAAVAWPRATGRWPTCWPMPSPCCAGADRPHEPPGRAPGSPAVGSWNEVGARREAARARLNLPAASSVSASGVDSRGARKGSSIGHDRTYGRLWTEQVRNLCEDLRPHGHTGPPAAAARHVLRPRGVDRALSWWSGWRSPPHAAPRRHPAARPRLPDREHDGPYGGYALGAGGRLPPLLLDDDEAIAVAVALRELSRRPTPSSARPRVAALTKLRPGAARARCASGWPRSVRSPSASAAEPAEPGAADATLGMLMALAQACRRASGCASTTGTGDDGQPAPVEPHRLVSLAAAGTRGLRPRPRRLADVPRRSRHGRRPAPGTATPSARRPTPPRSSPRAWRCASTRPRPAVRFARLPVATSSADLADGRRPRTRRRRRGRPRWSASAGTPTGSPATSPGCRSPRGARPRRGAPRAAVARPSTAARAPATRKDVAAKPRGGAATVAGRGRGAHRVGRHLGGRRVAVARRGAGRASATRRSRR